MNSQRKGVLKKTIAGDELRRRRESTANEIRKINLYLRNVEVKDDFVSRKKCEK